jgi:dihydrofolate reductase
MGRIVVTEYLSLDGVMDSPGGGPYKHAGWAFETDSGDEGRQFKFEEARSSAAMLLGRVTYEEFAAVWPTMEGTGEFGERMNGMPKYVISSTLPNAEWNNSTVLGGNLVDEVTRLTSDVDGNIVVHGSAQLVQGLLEHDLVDELRLMAMPVLLGSGKRLFGDLSDKRSLRVTQSRSVGDGVTIIVCERAC